VDAELVDASLKKKTSMSDSCQSLQSPAHSGAVTCVAVELTSSQQVLASGGHDATVRLWSVFNNHLLCSLVGHQQTVRTAHTLTVCTSPLSHSHRAVSCTLLST